MGLKEFTYIVGDLVRVREDLQNNATYKMHNSTQDNVAIKQMVRFAGDTVTITGINFGQYRIEQDDGRYLWTDEMFDGRYEDRFDDSEIDSETLSVLCGM